MQGVETMCPDTEAHTVEASVKRTSSGREKAVRNSSLLPTRIVLVSSQLYSKDGRLRELAQLTIIIRNAKIPPIFFIIFVLLPCAMPQ